MFTLTVILLLTIKIDCFILQNALHYYIRTNSIALYAKPTLFRQFLDSISLGLNKKPPPPSTPTEELIEYINYKPWKDGKIKNLKIHYKPWKDSWEERFRTENADTMYSYTIPKFRPQWDTTRIDELWIWPWLWTKIKAERLAWIHKVFYEDCQAMSVQEHMEMDAFFSEFDMPVRWGLLRMWELDTLNVIALNVLTATNFHGVEPTDIGLRPDGSVRLCPLQFHNCISSSNDPADTDHYAPPFKWDRSKSPEQAFDEIKFIYNNYPKRGLRWSSGWIDRGGWKPQLFNGNFFYSQAEALAFHYVDDIEVVLNAPKREVQIRSSSRMGQVDNDANRLRYNQFVRMLEKKGGWEVTPLPELNYIEQTPLRWMNYLINDSLNHLERLFDQLIGLIQNPSALDSSLTSKGLTKEIFNEMRSLITEKVDPLLNEYRHVWEEIQLNPPVSEALRLLDDLENHWNDWIVNQSNDKQKFLESIQSYSQRLQEMLSVPLDTNPSVVQKEEPSVQRLGLPSKESVQTNSEMVPSMGSTTTNPITKTRSIDSDVIDSKDYNYYSKETIQLQLDQQLLQPSGQTVREEVKDKPWYQSKQSVPSSTTTFTYPHEGTETNVEMILNNQDKKAGVQSSWIEVEKEKPERSTEWNENERSMLKSKLNQMKNVLSKIKSHERVSEYNNVFG